MIDLTFILLIFFCRLLITSAELYCTCIHMHSRMLNTIDSDQSSQIWIQSVWNIGYQRRRHLS